MSAIRTIVAGIEHLAADDPTLAAAAELARWTGAGLHLVHAYEFPHLHILPLPGAAASYAEELRGMLAAAAREVPGAGAAVLHVVQGSPARVLLRVAGEAGADLLVVGAGRRSRLGGAFLGTTAQRVLRGAGVPVFVARRPVRRPLERVLLTTDLSELSAAAHDRGLDTAAALLGDPAAARSLLVMVTPLISPPLGEEALERAARVELDAFLRARGRHGPAIEPVVRTGSPAEEIVAEAEAWKADLLVLGTHGSVMLGSVAEAALRDAPCNVLAVPPRAAPAGEAHHSAAGVAEEAGSAAPAGV